MTFEIGYENALYLCKHFTFIEESERERLESFSASRVISQRLMELGSKFLPGFSKGPFSLISHLNTLTPQEIIPQRENRIAYHFTFSEPVGIDAVIRIDLLSEDQQKRIVKRERGGILVWTFSSDSNIYTRNVILIAEDQKVITCFPGCLAPPLPSHTLSEEEFTKSTKFWNEHAFIYYEKYD